MRLEKSNCFFGWCVKIERRIFTENYVIPAGFLLSLLVVLSGSMGINYFRSYSDAIGLSFLDMAIPIEVHYYNSFRILSEIHAGGIIYIGIMAIAISFLVFLVDFGMRNKEESFYIPVTFVSFLAVSLFICLLDYTTSVADSFGKKRCFDYIFHPERSKLEYVAVVLDSKKEPETIKGFLLFANNGSTYIMRSYITNQDRYKYAPMPEKFCVEQKFKAKWEIIRFNNTKIMKIEPSREKDSSASSKKTCREPL